MKTFIASSFCLSDNSAVFKISTAGYRLKNLSYIVFLFVLPVFAAWGETIKSRSLEYRADLEVSVFARDAEILNVPVNWAQVDYCVPDGARVEEGEIVTRFNDEGLTNRLERLLIDRDTIEAGLAKQLVDIRNKDMALKDSLQTEKDRMVVLKTRLARLESLPDEDEVKIAEGRLRVASLEYEAAVKEMEKARDRYERKMISKAELERYRLNLDGRVARKHYAEALLEHAKRKADRLVVKKLKLAMENVAMQIDKLNNEIKENAGISLIQKEGAAARREIHEQKISECREDIENLVVKAPIPGHVMYLKGFRRHNRSGHRRLWKKFNYLKIPDMRSLAFKGLLLESDRKYFKKGDRAYLRARGSPLADITRDQPIQGTIFSISKMSHDRVEKEEGGWGDQNKSGVMVYDIVIVADEIPEGILVGMNFECEMVSSMKISGPSISASRVKEKGGEYFISINGVYVKVDGVLTGGYMVLDDSSLAGKEVGLYGKFPGKTRLEREKSGSAEFLTVSSELLPASSTDVPVEMIHGWQKVTWLAGEDSEVRAGDVLARLDNEETKEAISKTESRLKEAVSRRKAEEEEASLEKKNSAFNLAYEKNLFKMAEIDREIVVSGRDMPGIYRAERDLALARLDLEDTQRRLERVKGRDIVSPLEVNMLEREQRRNSLRVETAKIKLAELQRGPDKLELRGTRLALLRQKCRVENLEREIKRDRFRRNIQLARTRRHERRISKRLERLEECLENLVLKAPVAGVVQYAKIWNSGVLSKVNVGSAVGRRFVPLKIAALDRMYMNVKKKKKYYSRVKEGMEVAVEVSSLSSGTLKGVVSGVNFLFQNKRKKDAKLGLYSLHEPLGETVFTAVVEIESDGIQLKPGTTATVRFPFEE